MAKKKITRNFLKSLYEKFFYTLHDTTATTTTKTQTNDKQICVSIKKCFLWIFSIIITFYGKRF